MKKNLILVLLLSVAACSNAYGWFGWFASAKPEEPKMTPYEATLQLNSVINSKELTLELYKDLKSKGASHVCLLGPSLSSGMNVLDLAIECNNEQATQIFEREGLKPTQTGAQMPVLVILRDHEGIVFQESLKELKKSLSLGGQVSDEIQGWVQAEQKSAATKCTKLAQSKNDKDVVEKKKQCAKAERLATLSSIITPKPVAATKTEMKVAAPGRHAAPATTHSHDMPVKK